MKLTRRVSKSFDVSSSAEKTRPTIKKAKRYLLYFLVVVGCNRSMMYSACVVVLL